MPSADVERLADNLAAKVPAHCVTVAELQGLLLRFRKVPFESVTDVPSFLEGLRVVETITSSGTSSWARSKSS